MGSDGSGPWDLRDERFEMGFTLPSRSSALSPRTAGTGREQRLDGMQTTLDFAGFIPGPAGVVADLSNAGVSLYRGDYIGFGVNLIAAVPFFGDWFKAGRLAAKYGDEAVGIAQQAAKNVSVHQVMILAVFVNANSLKWAWQGRIIPQASAGH